MTIGRKSDKAHPALESVHDLLAIASEAMILVGDDGRIVLANPQAGQLFGYDSAHLLGAELEKLVPGPFRRDHKLHRSGYFSAPSVRSMSTGGRNLTGLRSDGNEIPIAVRLGPVRVGERQYVAATISDLSVVRDEQRTLDRLAAVVQWSDDAVISMTTDGVIQTCNPGAERILDRSAAWLVGQPVQVLLPVASQQKLAECCRLVCDGQRVKHAELEFFRRDGSTMIVEANVFGLRDGAGELIGYSMIGHDVTGVVELRQKLERLAHFDQLTGLASRAETLKRLKSALRCLRSPGPELGLLFCDVDEFKVVNDTWGHAAGDAVLATLATRIRDCLRHGDTIGRAGGDEILILLPGIHGLDDATQVAEKIRSSAAEPIHYGGETISVTLSVGATLAIHGESVSKTTARADRAMYQAKQSGRDQVVAI